MFYFLCSIRVLMEDIWNLSGNLNIYSSYHVYREATRIADYLIRKCIGIIDSRIWLSNLPKNVKYSSFVDHCISDFYQIAFVRLMLCSFPSLKKKSHKLKFT